METVYQSLVSVEPFTLVVTILNLFLQLFLIKKFLLDKVMAVLDQRRADADREITEAQQARQQAQTIKAAYEENMLRARAEAGDIIAQAQKTATTRGEEILHQAQEQVVRMKEKAARDIALEKKKALNDAKDEISEIAMAVAGKVIGRSLDSTDQSRLVNEFIDGLGEDL